MTPTILQGIEQIIIACSKMEKWRYGKIIQIKIKNKNKSEAKSELQLM